MPTFLVTPKMSPALAARIEDSVRGHRAAGSGPLAPRQVLLVRLALVLVCGVLVGSFLVARYRGTRQVEQARGALLLAVSRRGALLPADDRQAVARAESWLMRSARNYEGDLVADELRAPGALGATLARSAVYVHGPLDAFAASARIADAASTSAKDSFVLCLMDPPPSRSEKALLGCVRTAYSDGARLGARTANVHRLYSAEVGLPLLLPPWTERVQTAPGTWELARLRHELDKAPLDDAIDAATAGLLLFVMDEPGDGPGPTEIDGERPHEVRVGLVDLRSARVLLRLRRRADPSWISAATRSQYASGLDACRLALDVRESVLPMSARAPSGQL